MNFHTLPQKLPKINNSKLNSFVYYPGNIKGIMFHKSSVQASENTNFQNLNNLYRKFRH